VEKNEVLDIKFEDLTDTVEGMVRVLTNDFNQEASFTIFTAPLVGAIADDILYERGHDAEGEYEFKVSGVPDGEMFDEAMGNFIRRLLVENGLGKSLKMTIHLGDSDYMDYAVEVEWKAE
jgi:hypothetical protein